MAPSVREWPFGNLSSRSLVWLQPERERLRQDTTLHSAAWRRGRISSSWMEKSSGHVSANVGHTDRHRSQAQHAVHQGA